jgi:hypothetical protein
MKTTFRVSRKDIIKITVQNFETGKLYLSIKDNDFNSQSNIKATCLHKLQSANIKKKTKLLINISNESKSTFKSIECNFR